MEARNISQKYANVEAHHQKWSDMVEESDTTAKIQEYSRYNVSGNCGGLGETKLLISNLDIVVGEKDIGRLFCKFGNIVNCKIHCDDSGTPLGTADLVYSRFNDAIKAMRTNKGTSLFGRRMMIKLAAS